MWKEEESHFSTLQNLNIDYMNTSYFYVKINPNTIMSSRNKTIDNDAFPINYANNYQKKALSIQVHPVLKDSFNKKYQGIKVFVANNTDSILYFNTIDSYLYMKVQAKDKAGKWCDIEYIQQPFCNMSNYILGLKPAHYWAFSTPIYSGDFKTKMRVELSYINPANYPISYREANNAVIYSNEYDGNINLSQFRRKQRNFSDNIRRFNLN